MARPRRASYVCSATRPRVLVGVSGPSDATGAERDAIDCPACSTTHAVRFVAPWRAATGARDLARARVDVEGASRSLSRRKRPRRETTRDLVHDALKGGPLSIEDIAERIGRSRNSVQEAAREPPDVIPVREAFASDSGPSGGVVTRSRIWGYRLRDRGDEIADAIREAGEPLGRAAIVAALGMDTKTASRWATRAVEDGRLERVGAGKRTSYRLTGDG